MSFDHNQMVRIRRDAKFHGGKVGYFQFFGEGASSDCAVLSLAPTKKPRGAIFKTVLIAVGRADIFSIQP